METLQVRPTSVLAGAHQIIAPLPVDGTTYVEPRVLDVDGYGYLVGDNAAPGLIDGLLALPDVGVSPSVVEVVGIDFLPYTNTAGTSWNVPVPDPVIGGVLAGDLAVVDCISQEGTDVAVPSTPGGWQTRGSWGSTTGWIPRVTRFFKVLTGSEVEGTTLVTITTASARFHFFVRIIRNVDLSDYFAAAAATSASGQGTANPGPNPTSITTDADGAMLEIMAAVNIFPGGDDLFDGSHVSAGYELYANTAPDERGVVAAIRYQDTAGAEDPGVFARSFDNWTVILDAYKPAQNAGLTLLVASLASDTTETDVPATEPSLAHNEIQTITSVLPSGTFTLSYAGQTTAAINWNDTAATIQTRLRDLSNIGASDVVCTGGPLNLAPVQVEFQSALGNQDVALITASSGSVTIAETQKGHPDVTFTWEGSVNCPRWLDGPAWENGSAPQINFWSATPSSYIAGTELSVTASDHDTNQTVSAALLVIADADTSNPISDSFGSSVGALAVSAGSFGSITPALAGSKILAILGLSSVAAYTNSPNPTLPARFTRAAQVVSDRSVLDISISPPAPASADTPRPVQWTGSQDYVTGLMAIQPAGSAGSLTLAQVVADADERTWAEIAYALGAMYEVLELDLSGVPANAIVTAISATVTHAASARSLLRVTLVGIEADGTIRPCAELRSGGYPTDSGWATTTIATGDWVETADGAPLSDFSRFGIALFSTVRNPTVTNHQVYSVAATVNYEPGGPVVADVAAPTVPAEAISWSYSSDAGLPQTHTQVRVRAGWGWGEAVGFADFFFEDFGTVGAATTVLADADTWELYSSAGNAGFGVRRPSAIDVVADGTETSNGKALRIRASNGTGGDTGQLVSGGLKILRPFRYGRVEFTAKGSGDPDELLSPVVLLWPKLLPGETAGDEWPARGEIDLIENYSNRDTLTPVEFHVHRQQLGTTASGPFDSSVDESRDVDHEDPFTSNPLNGTGWHKYVFTWTPEKIAVEIDNGDERILESDPAWIPSGEMELTIQLDAWANSTLTTNPDLRIGYVRLQKLVQDFYPDNPLAPEDGDIVYDSGKLPGSLRRALSIESAPWPDGNATVSVRAWTRLPAGREIVSDWVSDSADISGSAVATGTQATDPTFDPATGGVRIPIVTPAGVSRVWLVRSTDQGVTWELDGPWDVSESSSFEIVDWWAPLAQATLRYQVAFDDGPMTETSAPVAVGSGDIDTLIADWYLICPNRPDLNVVLDVAGFRTERPRFVYVADNPERTVVVTSGALGRRFSITLRTVNAGAKAALDALLESGEEFRLVSILGESWWVKLGGGITESMLRGARPLPSEVTAHRSAHTFELDLIETRRG